MPQTKQYSIAFVASKARHALSRGTHIQIEDIILLHYQIFPFPCLMGTAWTQQRRREKGGICKLNPQ